MARQYLIKCAIKENWEMNRDNYSYFHTDSIFVRMRWAKEYLKNLVLNSKWKTIHYEIVALDTKCGLLWKMIYDKKQNKFVKTYLD